MTRDELRESIRKLFVPGELFDEDLAGVMALVDQYSVAIVQGVTPSYLPRPTEQEVLPWLKERK